MTKLPNDYAGEITNLSSLLRRISRAHSVALDLILRDLDLALCEDEEYTNEKYLGCYRTQAITTQARLNIPSQIRPAQEYDVYYTEWGDIIYRPHSPTKKPREKIIVGS